MVMVDADIIAVYLGRPGVQADGLGPKVSSPLALLCIDQMNWVKCQNVCATMTAPETLSYLLLFPLRARLSAQRAEHRCQRLNRLSDQTRRLSSSGYQPLSSQLSLR